MPRVLVLFAHPAYEKSRVNRRLVEAIADLDEITVHDLYEAYPDFRIDVAAEQARLVAHDVIVLQHPFYWYSAPALLKEYLDLVLEHGFAYGSQGHALDGKLLMNATTTGGAESAYQIGGRNRFTMRQLLAPFDQTAFLCRMTYLAPFVVHGALRIDAEGGLDVAERRYRALLVALRDGTLDLARAVEGSRINDLVADA
ncbi:NAD(P)H oxidoreductase [Luteitalea sp. TBR-22]|uniref:glutathione-regulated potassium-efflux system oxidoreductase KefF n=1 Tax=Luteitalea sp. TBR-22 TaxID=2802971 RepID=UPI001AF5DC9E|nr:NAD(P)H-dependent oxidoreductase [Luteitalea sp. TBR-22]BCS33648.1 NAD(P)H oxidoreductase [Luteitalea sp. TBR-22]